MKRRNRALIGLAAAAITFASLMAFVGPQRFARYRQHCGEHAQHWKTDDQPLQSTPKAQ
ncbi:MAG: hypothetical protein QM802_16175 [Agriterribacter sp.]